MFRLSDIEEFPTFQLSFTHDLSALLVQPFLPDAKRHSTPAAWSAYWGPDSNLKRPRAELKEGAGATRFKRLAMKVCHNR